VHFFCVRSFLRASDRPRVHSSVRVFDYFLFIYLFFEIFNKFFVMNEWVIRAHTAKA
jgi:hypothetical protein